MQYWLFKSEPLTFSIEDLVSRPNQTTHWDGVRNYQVRNMMRDQMKCGDLGFFYHSSCAVPGIAGIVSVVREGYPDLTAMNPESKYYDPKSTQANPRWFMVDVKLVKKFPRFVTLHQIKQHPACENMLINRKGNRLSVTPVTKEEWQAILSMA